MAAHPNAGPAVRVRLRWSWPGRGSLEAYVDAAHALETIRAWGRYAQAIGGRLEARPGGAWALTLEGETIATLATETPD